MEEIRIEEFQRFWSHWGGKESKEFFFWGEESKELVEVTIVSLILKVL